MPHALFLPSHKAPSLHLIESQSTLTSAHTHKCTHSQVHTHTHTHTHTCTHMHAQGEGKTVVHDNKYFTPNGQITECKMPLAQWQAKVCVHSLCAFALLRTLCTRVCVCGCVWVGGGGGGLSALPIFCFCPFIDRS
jgi:hypothetical protein